ncbi:hypothetical protein [Klebsiella michiganensis]|uniref:hypothetical protein n=1 Tax=Klebsiella michiganensis TaxID=1134687 RepID=UPI00027C478D|nr:hypothetical protein [Klebsiella michiganensis]EJU20919.1 hypothetical protein HMPREF1144_3358 [Klebsiella sp. OBRC7]MDM4125742.1 hypothetical protein [Klebsiella michiganensis]MDM4162597.1 hypothetical protein [Klebsiella michiganensis]MDS7753475.1 hypothetical protein [Klebsiella michiganensis]QUG49318.1 hypothetical protein KDU73_14510 [Klebsiella michiganensis]
MLLTDNFLADVFHAGHVHHAIDNMVNLHLRRRGLLLAAMVRRDGELKVEQ